MSSANPTPWAVICPHHGRVYLTEEEYRAQLDRPDEEWVCPVMVTDGEMPGPCGLGAEFDDENYEERSVWWPPPAAAPSA